MDENGIYALERNTGQKRYRNNTPESTPTSTHFLSLTLSLSLATGTSTGAEAGYCLRRR